MSRPRERVKLSELHPGVQAVAAAVIVLCALLGMGLVALTCRAGFHLFLWLWDRI